MEAILISCIRTRRVAGADETTHVGGKLPDGTPWLASFESIVEQIENGRRYFVASQAESMLVSVIRGHDGRKILGVGVEPKGCSTFPGIPARARGISVRARRYCTRPNTTSSRPPRPPRTTKA